MKETLKDIGKLLNYDISIEEDVNGYINELCQTVISCSTFIDYIGKYEERYQALFHVVPCVVCYA